MTIRETISKKVKVTLLSAIGGACIAGIGLTIQENWDGTWWWIYVPGLVICFGACLFQFYGIRCPKCNKMIGEFSYAIPSWYGKSKIMFCPRCGIPLDSKIETSEEVSK